MPRGNQNKSHGLDASLHLRVSPELKARLTKLAAELSKPGQPITPSDAARTILEAHFLTQERATHDTSFPEL